MKGYKPRPTPSWKTTYHARYCRMLDMYWDGYYEILSITMNMLKLDYAGYNITLWLKNGEVRSRPRKRHLVHLEKEDLEWLDRLAFQWLGASQEGIRILNEIRKEKSDFNRRCKEAEKMRKAEAKAAEKERLAAILPKQSDMGFPIPEEKEGETDSQDKGVTDR